MPSQQKNAPPAPFRQRLTQLRAELRKKNLPALLVTNCPDQIYLTGFTGEDGAVLVTSRSVILLTDGRFETSSKQEAPWATTKLRKGPLSKALAQVVRRAKLTQVAFQTEFTSVSDINSFRRAARGVKFIQARKIIGKLRTCKDPGEVAAIENAIRIAESAFRATGKAIRPGQTERQVAARLEFEMQRRGGHRASFPTIVAEGPNAALPHAKPGNRKIRRGSAILIDWGTFVDHYCSDLTRVVFLGKPPLKIARIYEIVLEAQLQAIRAIKPGMDVREIDKVARKVISDAGYGKRFGHGLGHGIGLEIHEPPRLSYAGSGRLEAGMVVTIEPGIYLPGIGGVRIEDDVLVTETGARVLSRLKEDLASARL